MKLRNKKTGEIVEITMPIKNGDGWNISANSLAELNEDWEDYEEKKSYYYITSIGEIVFRGFSLKKWNGADDRRKHIGNYFETREEAEKAVEKLKAWKRLKDKGFRFKGYLSGDGAEVDRIYAEFPYLEGNKDPDLDLLFGGEE